MRLKKYYITLIMIILAIVSIPINISAKNTNTKKIKKKR